MKGRSRSACLMLIAMLMGPARARAMDISGTITATLTIFQNSKLTGDVTCAVTGAPCIVVQNPFAFVTQMTLDLNGFTITGQADPQAACSGGGANGSESGIVATGQNAIVIRGPGIVQGFRGHGISLSGVSQSTITGVTTATNCFSGIFVTGGSANNLLESNISIRNGNVSSPCGGI